MFYPYNQLQSTTLQVNHLQSGVISFFSGPSVGVEIGIAKSSAFGEDDVHLPTLGQHAESVHFVGCHYRVFIVS